VIGYPWKTDRPQIDGVIFGQLIDSVIRHHFPGTGKTFAIPIKRFPFEADVETPPDCFEHPHALRDDLVADTVAGDHRYFMRWHRLAPLLRFWVQRFKGSGFYRSQVSGFRSQPSL
jgi:hypothetical protein